MLETFSCDSCNRLHPKDAAHRFGGSFSAPEGTFCCDCSGCKGCVEPVLDEMDRRYEWAENQGARDDF